MGGKREAACGSLSIQRHMRCRTGPRGKPGACHTWGLANEASQEGGLTAHIKSAGDWEWNALLKHHGDLFKKTWVGWRGWSTVETKVLIEKELWAVSRGGLQIGMKSLGCKRFGEYPSPQETQGQNCKKRVCRRREVRKYHAMLWVLATVYSIAHIGELFLLWCSTRKCLKCISGYFSLLLPS